MTQERRAYFAAWYQKNKERILARQAAWRKANPEVMRERTRRYNATWRKKNPDKWKSLYAEWREANPDYAAAWARKNRYKTNAHDRVRDAAERRAAPVWRDRAAIVRIYEEARRISLESGVQHHVDHIVPLRHQLVCGLHVAYNLRIVPARENMVKGNRLWPDMP